MKHILIITHARTGGTWAGQLLDTCPNVKYVWEPDEPSGQGDFLSWDFDNQNAVATNVLNFKPHVELKPKFPKTDIDTAVYKTISLLGLIACGGSISQESCEQIVPQRVKEIIPNIQQKLDAKIIHLIRHPIRWIASVQRWGPRSQEKLDLACWIYSYANIVFNELSKRYPWYYCVRHEDLIRNDHNDIDRLFDFCGLKRTSALENYLSECHSSDSNGSPHIHETTMTKETVLNRWQTFESQQYLAHINELTKGHWDSLYPEPLDINVHSQHIS